MHTELKQVEPGFILWTHIHVFVPPCPHSFLSWMQSISSTSHWMWSWLFLLLSSSLAVT